MDVKFTNNGHSTLAASASTSDTSITVASGHGARFPSLSGSAYFFATLIDASNNLEIVKCTARSSDVLTITRAQESTTARAFAIGDRIELRVTAAGLGAIYSEAVADATPGADTIVNSMIATDAVNADSIAANAVGASELNVSGNGSSGNALLSDGDGTFSCGTAGGIVQVKQITIKDSYSYSGSSYQSMAVTGSITPTSSSNHILVMITLGRITNIGNNSTTFKILRGGSNIIAGNSAGSRDLFSFSIKRINSDGNHTQGGISYTYLDAPNTTSSTTYILQGLSENGGTFYLNRSATDANIANNYNGRGASTLIMMEVVGGIVT
jgi:hypothetical protein